jgi:hypothetical protein
MMDATTCPTRDDRLAEGSANRAVTCPFCDGVLVPQRDAYRCLRCCFSICPGCDVASVSDDAGSMY